MARIRTIKPEFPQSETIGKLSRDARLLFILLWTLVDDAGRTRAASRMLASLLYPYDDDAPKLIGKWLSELEKTECVRRYDVEGSTYLDIPNWSKHQKIDRPTPSRLPSFDEQSPDAREASRALDADLGPSTVDHGPSTMDQSSRTVRAREIVLMDDWPPNAFDIWYEQFPKKVGKLDAGKAFERTRKKNLIEFENLMAATQRYAVSRIGQDAQYTKAPAAWLNAGRWDDDPAALSQASPPRGERIDGRVRALLELSTGEIGNG